MQNINFDQMQMATHNSPNKNECGERVYMKNVALLSTFTISRSMHGATRYSVPNFATLFYLEAFVILLYLYSKNFRS